MLRTEFLTVKDYPKYGEWLRRQDRETLELYFGVGVSDSIIDSLMEKIINYVPAVKAVVVVAEGTATLTLDPDGLYIRTVFVTVPVTYSSTVPVFISSRYN